MITGVVLLIIGIVLIVVAKMVGITPPVNQILLILGLLLIIAGGILLVLDVINYYPVHSEPGTTTTVVPAR